MSRLWSYERNKKSRKTKCKIFWKKNKRTKNSIKEKEGKNVSIRISGFRRK